MKKWGSSVFYYFQKFETIVDTLAAAEYLSINSYLFLGMVEGEIK